MDVKKEGSSCYKIPKAKELAPRNERESVPVIFEGRNHVLPYGKRGVIKYDAERPVLGDLYDGHRWLVRFGEKGFWVPQEYLSVNKAKRVENKMGLRSLGEINMAWRNYTTTDMAVPPQPHREYKTSSHHGPKTS
jgi:hypothetical protein